MPERRITDHLAYMIASVNRQLEDELQERLRPAGIPIEQFRILETLDQAGTCSMGELAERALVEPPTLTKIIDRMVSDALVQRAPDAHDRRRVMIVIAPAGKALYRRLHRVSTSQEERLAKQLRADKADELRTLLRELIGS